LAAAVDIQGLQRVNKFPVTSHTYIGISFTILKVRSTGGGP